MRYTESIKTVSCALACAALALAGCDTTATGTALPPVEGNRSAVIEAPVNPPQTETAAAPATAPVVVPRPEELMGASIRDAELMMGAPALRRVDRGSEMWQYPSEACVLFVFFYPDDGGEMAVSYITTTVPAPDAVQPDDAACIDAAVRASFARASAASS